MQFSFWFVRRLTVKQMIIGDLGKLSFLIKILQTSFLYFLSHYFKLLNMDNVILNQNIQFKCNFSFDLCDGLQ